MAKSKEQQPPAAATTDLSKVDDPQPSGGNAASEVVAAPAITAPTIAKALVTADPTPEPTPESTFAHRFHIAAPDGNEGVIEADSVEDAIRKFNGNGNAKGRAFAFKQLKITQL